jgi:hypothetical protein
MPVSVGLYLPCLGKRMGKGGREGGKEGRREDGKEGRREGGRGEGGS